MLGALHSADSAREKTLGRLSHRNRVWGCAAARDLRAYEPSSQQDPHLGTLMWLQGPRRREGFGGLDRTVAPEGPSCGGGCGSLETPLLSSQLPGGVTCSWKGALRSFIKTASVSQTAQFHLCPSPRAQRFELGQRMTLLRRPNCCVPQAGSRGGQAGTSAQGWLGEGCPDAPSQ